MTCTAPSPAVITSELKRAAVRPPDRAKPAASVSTPARGEVVSTRRNRLTDCVAFDAHITGKKRHIYSNTLTSFSLTPFVYFALFVLLFHANQVHAGNVSRATHTHKGLRSRPLPCAITLNSTRLGHLLIMIT